jgi:type I restriction enzyme, S subunit
MAKDISLPDGWKLKSIDELYYVIGGGTPSTAASEFWSGDIPWITSADIHGLKDIRPRKKISENAISNSATNLVPAGSVIVVTRVSLGKVALANFPLCFSQDSQSLIAKDNSVLPEYALYYLSQSVQIFKYQGRGTTISGVTKKQLKDLPFPLPPLPEQERIVAKIEELFTQLDAGVAGLRRVQAALKRYKASLLKAACEGRLVAQDPNDEPASKLLRTLGQLPLELTDYPQSPKGWCWVRWNQVGISQNGRGFPSKEYQTCGVKLLRPGNLYANGNVVWTSENTRYMPEKWALEFPAFIIGPNELVINLTAQSLKDEFLGRVCITGQGESCLLNQRLARLKPLIGETRFYLCLFKSKLFRQFVDGLNTGSLIQHMFTKQLANFVFPLPPLAEQHRIVAEVERRMSVIQELEQTIDASLKRASRLRQAILKQAFEGRLV